MFKGESSNKYKDIIATKPDYLIPVINGKLDTSDINLIIEKASKFKKVIVEIGSGSGLHLITLASKNPDTFHLGFELRFKRSYRSAEKSELLGLKNILFVRTNANCIPEIFNKNSLNGIYINFPDPWIKRRWHKHRILSVEFLTKLSSAMKPTGFISYKTDSLDYFNSTLKVINSKQMSELFEIDCLTEDLYNSDYILDNIQTEFEQLWVQKNNYKIYKAKASS